MEMGGGLVPYLAFAWFTVGLAPRPLVPGLLAGRVVGTIQG